MSNYQDNSKVIAPQPGFQTQFIGSPADITIAGAAAGVGKTYAMLIDPLPYVAKLPDFESVFFRRTYPEIANPGGLKSTSNGLYPLCGGHLSGMDWTFYNGSKIVFRHLQHESDIHAWQGAQVPAIYFDELTHFTRHQFFYMISRNRNPHANGLRSFMKASCNPDPDSFVAELLEWWIDQVEQLEDGSPNPQYGYPIPERIGALRYMAVENDEMIWGDTPEEVIDKAPHMFSGDNAGVKPKSLTFIPGSIYQNKILLQNDPGYLAGLLSLPEAEQNKLLRGNWKVRFDGSALYNPSSVSSIFTNYLPVPLGSAAPTRYITADIAKFGRDWTVIYAWIGWEIVGCVVLKVNDSVEAVSAIEFLRLKFGIQEHNVLVDQNGVGGDVLALRPRYVGFLNNGTTMDDPQTKVKENYENLKTQVYYRNGNRVNQGAMRVSLNQDNTWIYESVETGTFTSGVATYNHNRHNTTKTKLKGKVVDIRDLIVADLRAIRKIESDPTKRLRINNKDAQKILLAGRSPDFGDPIAMREYFELTGHRRAFGGFDNS
ncbi:terminase large subunit domain-containing protein [Spirosoma spitsbergense]|uniref:terminase large subunit domain-containing protein n=1 Tax=Spirosoma spitsbergense TaxID=431554 RepID=UPI000368C94A|nr:terminase family protein [Spirosoma spitsbergense]